MRDKSIASDAVPSTGGSSTDYNVHSTDSAAILRAAHGIAFRFRLLAISLHPFLPEEVCSSRKKHKSTASRALTSGRLQVLMGFTIGQFPFFVGQTPRCNQAQRSPLCEPPPCRIRKHGPCQDALCAMSLLLAVGNDLLAGIELIEEDGTVGTKLDRTRVGDLPLQPSIPSAGPPWPCASGVGGGGGATTSLAPMLRLRTKAHPPTTPGRVVSSLPTTKNFLLQYPNGLTQTVFPPHPLPPMSCHLPTLLRNILFRHCRPCLRSLTTFRR